MQYLVGTPKGRLNRLEKHLLDKPWQNAREGVKVKLLAEDGELYVFAESHDRVTKERAMRRRQLKWLWKRLRQIATMEISREELLMKLGGARFEGAGRVASCRYRDRQGAAELQLRAQPQETEKDAATRRPLSTAHQSHRQ